MNPVEVLDVAVERGGKAVLNGLSLSIAPGSVYALLGGNGSGKTTTLFVLLGLLRPGAGAVKVVGHDPSRQPDAVRAATAYLAENVALYEHLSARENVEYFLGLAGQKRARKEIETALSSVRLDSATWDRRVGSFSKGMRQKTAIALAVLRKTPVLLLDEPTSGLDPAATNEFHTLLGELRAQGVAILMVTHDLLGAVDSADVIGLIDRGRLAQEWRAAAGEYDIKAMHRAFAGQSA
jgi:ABC-2 type transport system ATP-binding protein